MRVLLFVIIGAVLSATICQISGQKAYLFHKSSKANWFKANVFCQTNNMRLVSIHSLKEHNLILAKADELGLRNVGWWTAGNDLAEEGKFYWGFNQRKTYTNWDVRQPDNAGGNEHCTVIWNQNGGFFWNDRPCTEENLFICEYYLNSRKVGAGNLTLGGSQTKGPLSLD